MTEIFAIISTIITSTIFYKVLTKKYPLKAIPVKVERIPWYQNHPRPPKRRYPQPI